MNHLPATITTNAIPMSHEQSAHISLPDVIDRPPLTISVKATGRSAVAVCDQIRAVDKSRLINRTGTLSKTDMQEIDKGLHQVLVL